MTMTADDLRRVLGPPGDTPAGCACAGLRCPGWESVPAPPGEPLLQCLGTLRPAGDEEPTLEEFHPAGTRYWSADAPVATAYFPYNRCDVWRCRQCGRGFLQYTEYGGYYVDHRIRELDPARLV
jgi:hypothetical protein